MADVAGIKVKQDNTIITYFRGLTVISVDSKEAKEDLLASIAQSCNDVGRQLYACTEASDLDVAADDTDKPEEQVPWGKDLVAVIDLQPYGLPSMLEGMIMQVIKQINLKDTLCIVITAQD